MRKAQVSFEFILLVSISFVILIIFFNFVTERISATEENRFARIFRDEIYSLRSEFQMAAGFEDGYNRDFTVPSLISQRNYTIGIQANTLYANTTTQEVSFPVPPITGTIQKGTNHIRKTGGVIYLN